MKDASFRITLDVNEIQSQVSIPVKVGDTNRKIYISLTEDSIPFAIGEGDYAILTGTSRSGLNIERTCTIEGGKIVVDFDDDIVSSERLLTCEIRLYNFETNGMLCSASFSIVVYDRVATFPKEELEAAGYDVDYIDNIILAEETREEKETERIRAENIRVDNEKARCDAESERVIEFNRVKTETEIATEAANKATEEISGLIPAANEAVNNANTQAEYAKTQAERAEAVADNIEDEVEGIYREITGKISFDVVEGYWIRNNDGSFASDTKYSMTEPIDCAGLDSITIQHNFTYVGNNAFYDESGGFVGSINLYKNPYTTTVPDNAVTFRLSALTDELKEAKIFVGQGLSERVTNLEEEQKNLKESISEQDAALEATNDRVAVIEDSLSVEEEIDYEVVPKEYVNKDGTITKGSTGWSRTDAVECVPGSVLDITGASSAYNAFYNSDGSFNSTFSIPCEKMVVPDGATSFMLSTENAVIGNIKITRYTSLSEQISDKVSTVNGVAPDENGNVEIAMPKAKTSCETDGECYFVRKEMKTYFTDYPEAVTDLNANSYIDGKIASVPQGDSFLFVTDMHYTDNNKNSLMPMLYAYKRLGLKTVVHGGDVLCETIDRNLATLELRKWTDDMRSCFGKYMLPVFGNHDANWADITFGEVTDINQDPIIPYSIVENIFLNGNRSAIVQEIEEEIRLKALNWFPTITDEDMENFVAWYKLHYYFDDHEHKTRHIILNKAGFSPIVRKYAKSDAEFEYRMQFEWLYDVLLDTPDDYNIVISSHILTDYNTNTISSAALSIMNLLSLAKNNGSAWIDITVGHDGNSFIFENKQFDFSVHNRTGKIICLCGHSHWDSACVCHTVDGTYKSEVYTDSLTIGDDGVLVIMTQTDAIDGQVTETEATERNYPAYSATMTSDTVTEQCFDIVTLTDDKVVCTRIGAGEDRVFNY